MRTRHRRLTFAIGGGAALALAGAFLLAAPAAAVTATSCSDLTAAPIAGNVDVQQNLVCSAGLVLSGDLRLTVGAGYTIELNGTTGAGVDTAGHVLTFAGPGALYVRAATGAIGSSGTDGAAGLPGPAGGWGGPGGSGQAGGSGGTGAPAVEGSLIVSGGDVYLYGGRGGDGGNGGSGGAGGAGTLALSAGGVGGQGGPGGSGGVGGSGVHGTITLLDGSLTIIAGDGSPGGAGGAGGVGGQGGNAPASGSAGPGGTGGEGGQGGSGGSGGSPVSGSLHLAGGALTLTGGGGALQGNGGAAGAGGPGGVTPGVSGPTGVGGIAGQNGSPGTGGLPSAGAALTFVIPAFTDTTVGATRTIVFPAGLRLAAPPATATIGDTITVQAYSLDGHGADIADVSGGVTLTSSVASDTVSGASVTFHHASPHVITVAYGGLSTSFTVEVSPAAELAATGIDPAPWLLGGGLLVLVGAGLVLLRTRRAARE